MQEGLRDVERREKPGTVAAPLREVNDEINPLLEPSTRPATRLTSCSAPSRTKAAARRYFERAIAVNGVLVIVLVTVTIDKIGANLAGINAINSDREMPTEIRQSKHLSNVVEQDD